MNRVRAIESRAGQKKVFSIFTTGGLSIYPEVFLF
jgi:hypothetical protein